MTIQCLIRYASLMVAAALIPLEASAIDEKVVSVSAGASFSSPSKLGREGNFDAAAVGPKTCTLEAAGKVCKFDIKVRKATIVVGANSYRICVAEFPYSELVVKTNASANLEFVGILWRLVTDTDVAPADQPAIADIAFAPGSGVVIANKTKVISEFETGFIANLRLNDQSVAWYAKALPRGTRFEGRHAAAVVVRLPENNDNLTVCVPVDPPITNTGY